MLDEANFCFMFAQKYHSAMKYVGPIRKELGFRTVFNILGPLTNPARPEFFLLGVYDEYLVEPIAKDDGVPVISETTASPLALRQRMSALPSPLKSPTPTTV